MFRGSLTFNGVPDNLERRSNQTHESSTDADAKRARKGNGKEAKLSFQGNLLVENRNGLIINAELFEANGNRRARCGLSDARADSRQQASYSGRRQGIRHQKSSLPSAGT